MMRNDEASHDKSQVKPSRAQPQREEDLDFEILDALENIDAADNSASAAPTGQGDDFDLDLDDDLMFDKDTPEFPIGTEMAAEFASGDLSEDNDASAFDQAFDESGFDPDLEDDLDDFMEHADDDGRVAVHFGDDAEKIELTFDDDELNLNLDRAPGRLDSEETSATSASAGLDLGAGDASAFEANDDLAGEGTESALEFTSSLTSEEEPRLNRPGTAADELPEEDDESSDFEGDEDDIDFDNMPDLDETMAEFASDFESGPSALDRDDDQSEMELAAMKNAHKNEAVSGKGVFSIDGDQVIDLGDEDDISSIADADSTSWGSDEELQADGDFFDDGAEDDFFDDADFDADGDLDDDAELAELAKGAQQIVDQTLDEESEEPAAGEDPDFMASLDDIQIDLHDEDEDDVDAFSADSAEDFTIPEDLAGPDEDVVSEEFGVPSLSEVLADVHAEPEFDEGFEVELSASAGPGAESPAEPEVDVREALGLVPRLADQDVRKFDQMILEAKTLQQYIEELETHKPEIKTAIYVKLLKEYGSRKANIFREPEFISIRIDVEQDLEDMVRKRADVQRTIGNLTDELEEIRVRHLVGEYGDAELSDQERSRNTEIETWQSKNDRLGQFIAQYQDLLESEHALNPLETAAPPEDSAPVDAILPENQAEASMLAEELASLVSTEDTDLEKTPTDEEALIVEDTTSAESPSGLDDEAYIEEEAESEDEEMVDEDAPTEGLAAADFPEDELGDMANLGDLTGILEEDEDGDEWDTDAAEDVELTAESFEADDFSLDADFADDEGLNNLDEDEFELDGLTDTDQADDETLGALAFEGPDDVGAESDAPDEAMVTCKKCGRNTPASEKFCVNCGAKTR